MSVSVSQVIEDVLSLSAKDRTFLARCLISTLDNENIDQEWAKVANDRYKNLKSGKVVSVSWDMIKKEVKL